MILLVDNYDSFAYNLYQLIGSIDPNIKVIRNDEMTVDEIEKIDPNTIVISPGPGKPSEAGNIEEIIKYFYIFKNFPVFFTPFQFFMRTLVQLFGYRMA